MTPLRLLGVHLRLGILNELQYRTNLVAQLASSLVGLLTDRVWARGVRQYSAVGA